MKTVYKHQLRENYTVLSMVKGAKILCLQMQHGVPCIWAEVAITEIESGETEPRAFGIYGTGGRIPDGDAKYISTVQDAPFVWHVYESDTE